MTNNTQSDRDLSKRLESAINLHGYGFQYRVAKEIEDLNTKGISSWILSVAEFPVEVQGSGTRIDLILKHSNRPFYIVAECKRVNPALSNWCFAKASYVPPTERADFAFVERVREVNRRTHASLANLYQTDEIYHVAIPVRSGMKGEASGGGRDQIEQASTQVCRGLNGLIRLFSVRRNSFGSDHVVGLLPVIFTTAELYTTDIAMSDADIRSGNISLQRSDLKKKDWIFFHYHQSPGLKHQIPMRGAISDLRDILYTEYVRTLAIVNSNGIEDFLVSGVGSNLPQPDA